jgi:Fic family protein
MEGNTISDRDSRLIWNYLFESDNKSSVDDNGEIGQLLISPRGRELANHFQTLRRCLSQDIASLGQSSLQDLHRSLMLGVDVHSEYRRPHESSRPHGYSTLYAMPLEVPELMRRLFEWLRLPLAAEWSGALWACQVLLKFLHIHPFADGNGRIGRLLFLMALQKHDLPVVVFYSNQLDQKEQYLTPIYDAQERDTPRDFYSLVLDALEART